MSARTSVPRRIGSALVKVVIPPDGPGVFAEGGFAGSGFTRDAI
jgi:hypothetical protein